MIEQSSNNSNFNQKASTGAFAALTAPSLGKESALEQFEKSPGQTAFAMMRQWPLICFEAITPKNRSNLIEKPPQFARAQAYIDSLFLSSEDEERIKALGDQEFIEMFEALPPDVRMRTFARIAHQIFESSSSLGWNEDGTPRIERGFEVPSDCPKIDFPVLSGRFSSIESVLGDVGRIVGISRFEPIESLTLEGIQSALIDPIFVRDDFLELTFNYLQCIVRHGTGQPQSGLENIEDLKIYEARWLEAQAEAWVSFQRLAQLYPDKVPSYCSDLVGAALIPIGATEDQISIAQELIDLKNHNSAVYGPLIEKLLKDSQTIPTVE